MAVSSSSVASQCQSVLSHTLEKLCPSADLDGTVVEFLASVTHDWYRQCCQQQQTSAATKQACRRDVSDTLISYLAAYIPALEDEKCTTVAAAILDELQQTAEGRDGPTAATETASKASDVAAATVSDADALPAASTTAATAATAATATTKPSDGGGGAKDADTSLLASTASSTAAPGSSQTFTLSSTAAPYLPASPPPPPPPPAAPDTTKEGNSSSSNDWTVTATFEDITVTQEPSFVEQLLDALEPATATAGPVELSPWASAAEPTLAAPATPTTAPTAPASAPICRHFMTGSCRRSDCWYSHDVASVPCRFWNSATGCTNGKDCVFLHAPGATTGAGGGAGAHTSTDTGTDDTAPPAAVSLGAAAFPSLQAGGSAAPPAPAAAAPLTWSAVPAASPAPASSAGLGLGLGLGAYVAKPRAARRRGRRRRRGQQHQGAAAPAAPPKVAAPPLKNEGPTLTAAQQLTVQELQRRFSDTRVAPTVDSLYRRCNFDGAAAEAKLRAQYASLGLAQPTKPTMPAAAARQRLLPRHAATNVVPHQGPHAKRDAVGWVATGNALRKQYEDLRTEAIVHAKQRNAFFQRAADAYRCGDGALARQLSRQGRKHDDIMKTLHKRAAQAIFAQRNKTSMHGHRRSGAVPTIDLHGLHVKEALAVLDVQLEACATAANASLYVITGTGHHARQGRAKLLPAVVRYAKSLGIRVEEQKRSDGRGGTLRLRLK